MMNENNVRTYAASGDTFAAAVAMREGTNVQDHRRFWDPALIKALAEETASNEDADRSEEASA